MWQEILAIDCRLSEKRMAASSNRGREDKDLRPLYLKRRLQLLKAQQKPLNFENQDPDSQPVMRNKKYISLRVKLLKKQFGLPNDLVSLRSLSLAASPASQDTNYNNPKGQQHQHSLEESAAERAAYNGVLHVLEHPSGLSSSSRLLFGHNDSSMLICGTGNGLLHIYNLNKTKKEEEKLVVCQNGPVADFDLSESNELLVASGHDGSVLLWDAQTGKELRKLDNILPRSAHVWACRFLPRNNNLIVCALSTGVLQILNVSTGKFCCDGSGALLLGRALCVAMNSVGNLVWVGNDRGYIESFRINCATGKIQKGCRVQAHCPSRPVTSLTARTLVGKITTDPCLMATLAHTDQLCLFRITDEFGTILPFRSFSESATTLPTSTALMCATIAPILSSRQGTVCVAGCGDGSLLFFDLEKDSRPCINKLLGHSNAVIAVNFSHDESYLASADQTGQLIVWKKS